MPNTEVLRHSGMCGIDYLSSDSSDGVGICLRAEGKRRHGGQHPWYKDVLKRDLNARAINPESWEEIALNRSFWQ